MEKFVAIFENVYSKNIFEGVTDAGTRKEIGEFKKLMEIQDNMTDAAREDFRRIEYRRSEREKSDKTYTENRESCKRIADACEAIARGAVYRCPKCGMHVVIDEAPEDDIYICECGEVCNVSEMENVDFGEYFENDLLDIEYICNGEKEYRAVRACVAWGGPSIYIDTDKKAVCLYWWTDSATYPLSSDAVDAIDEFFEMLFNC